MESRMKSIWFFCISFLCLLVSCVQPYQRSTVVKTNTFSDQERLPSGFVLRDSFVVHPVKDKNSLLAKELQGKIETYLGHKGYTTLAPMLKKNASYILLFSYGTTSSIEVVKEPVIVPGRRHVVRHHVPRGRYHRDGLITPGRPDRVVYVPSRITEYTSFLKAEVYDVKDAQAIQREEKPLPLWEGKAIMSGDNAKDIRRSIDYLMSGLFRYFGKSSERQRGVRVSEGEIEWLR